MANSFKQMSLRQRQLSGVTSDPPLNKLQHMKVAKR